VARIPGTLVAVAPMTRLAAHERTVNVLPSYFMGPPAGWLGPVNLGGA
jgi:hypothetical protein